MEIEALKKARELHDKLKVTKENLRLLELCKKDLNNGESPTWPKKWVITLFHKDDIRIGDLTCKHQIVEGLYNTLIMAFNRDKDEYEKQIKEL